MWILCHVFHVSDRKIICRVRVVSQSFFVFRATFCLRPVFCRFHIVYGLEELLKLFAFSRALFGLLKSYCYDRLVGALALSACSGLESHR